MKSVGNSPLNAIRFLMKSWIVIMAKRLIFFSDKFKFYGAMFSGFIAQCFKIFSDLLLFS